MNFKKIKITVFIVLSINFLFYSCQKNESENENDMLVDSVRSFDDVNIVYDVQGKGDTTLFFIHCWCGDRTYWDNQTDYFKDNYKIVRIDLAGHGGSALGRKDYTMESFGKDVAAVINLLELDKCILIGHSMGGPVMLEAARILGDKIIGLVGVDNLIDVEEKYPEEDFLQFVGWLENDFVNSVPEFVKSMFPENADSNLVKKIAEDMSSAPKEVAISAMKSLYYQDIISVLKDVKCPIVCISSDKYPTNIEGNRKHMKSFNVKLMKGYGHFLQLENPEMFNKLLEDTIKEF
ncbi:MAG: alpha/beta hydrolase [Ignavibacteriales bacterium]|nr:alpha/beta hydrolase [Ignavibacteriales bacterium]